MTENLINPHHTWKVFVEDNFHFSDESERYLWGEYDSHDAAVTACKKIVDRFLESQCKPSASFFSGNMTAESLYVQWSCFGEDPFIVGDDSSNLFSALDYARERCAVICSSGVSRNEQSA